MNQDTAPTYYYPNKMGRIILLATEEILGRNGLNAVLNRSKQSSLINNFPPNNLDLEFKFSEISEIQATLEEITEADLLLHIVDISHPNALLQAESVHQTLEKIGASHVPIVTAFNKLDKLRDPDAAQQTLQQFQNAVAISATKGTGIPALLKIIQVELYEQFIPIDVKLPYQQGQLISLFHEAGQIERIEHERGGVLIQGRIPGRMVAQFIPWQNNHNNETNTREEQE